MQPGERLPRLRMVPDVGCRNTVYQSAAQAAAEYLPAVRKLGVRAVLAGESDGARVWRSLSAASQLGVTRGTLRPV